MSGIQKLLITIIVSFLALSVFLVSTSSDQKNPSIFADKTITRTIDMEPFGEYSVDIPTGEIFELRYSDPTFIGLEKIILGELEPGILMVESHLTEKGIGAKPWDPNAPRDVQPNYTTIQIWQEMNRVYIHSIDVEQIEGGMRLNYFAINRPDLLPELKGLERQFGEGLISKKQITEKAVTVFEKEGLLPNLAGNRRRVKDLLLALYR